MRELRVCIQDFRRKQQKIVGEVRVSLKPKREIW